MKSFFKAKEMCNRVQEASVHPIIQITEIKVQYYSVTMTTVSTANTIIIKNTF